MNSPRCPALWFVYILIPGKEEWVLVYLGSQHKCVERPVRPVFPDSVSYDYAITKLQSNGFEKVTNNFLFLGCNSIFNEYLFKLVDNETHLFSVTAIQNSVSNNIYCRLYLKP